MKRWREDLRTPLTLREASVFIGSVEWRFAKTMPEHPHWYTMSPWCADGGEQFRGLVLSIVEQGVRIPWPKPPAQPLNNHRCLLLDGWKHWFMDNDPMVAILINRAVVEPADHRYQHDADSQEWRS